MLNAVVEAFSAYAEISKQWAIHSSLATPAFPQKGSALGLIKRKTNEYGEPTPFGIQPFLGRSAI